MLQESPLEGARLLTRTCHMCLGYLPRDRGL
ncbi:hypothetical protein VPHD148_0259 [Vibrio phage D148]